MRQQYDQYTPENHGTWKLLFDRQASNLHQKACTEYLVCLNDLSGSLHAPAIPNFRDLDGELWRATGWTVEVVPGLIPVADFFDLLARRRFCSSTWIRRRDQLDYLEEPDMFHDIFGHVPLLLDPTYANFMQRFGELGTRFAHDPAAVRRLERLYWFTIEFGLLLERGKPRIYGAGILSSFGETNHIFTDVVTVLPFDVETIMNREFRTDVMQTEYYAIRSFRELWECLEKAEELLKAMPVSG